MLSLAELKPEPGKAQAKIWLNPNQNLDELKPKSGLA